MTVFSSTMLKTIIANIAILLVLILLMEAAVRVFVPEIGPLGVDSSLIEPGRFGDSPGLAPSASGLNYGVRISTTSDGFIRYSTSMANGYVTNAMFGTTSPSDSGTVKTGGWLLLGDSVTMPIAVESDSSFAGRLAQAVSDSLVILNSALIGYSTHDYLNVARNLISSHGIKPGRVTIFWCLNDVYSEQADGGEHQVRRRVSGFQRFLQRHVYTWQWLRSLSSDHEKGYFEYDRQFYEEGNPAFEAAMKNLEEIRDLATGQDIRFDIVIMPYEYQFRSGDYGPQDVLLTRLPESGISVIDARYALAGRDDIHGLYLYSDGIHFNGKGHRLLGEWMKNNIIQTP